MSNMNKLMDELVFKKTKHHCYAGFKQDITHLYNHAIEPETRLIYDPEMANYFNLGSQPLGIPKSYSSTSIVSVVPNHTTAEIFAMDLWGILQRKEKAFLLVTASVWQSMFQTILKKLDKKADFNPTISGVINQSNELADLQVLEIDAFFNKYNNFFDKSNIKLPNEYQNILPIFSQMSLRDVWDEKRITVVIMDKYNTVPRYMFKYFEKYGEPLTRDVFGKILGFKMIYSLHSLIVNQFTHKEDFLIKENVLIDITGLNNLINEKKLLIDLSFSHGTTAFISAWNEIIEDKMGVDNSSQGSFDKGLKALKWLYWAEQYIEAVYKTTSQTKGINLHMHFAIAFNQLEKLFTENENAAQALLQNAYCTYTSYGTKKSMMDYLGINQHQWVLFN